MTKETIKNKVTKYLKAQANEFVTPDNLVIVTDDDKLTFQFDGDLAEYINFNSYDCDSYYFDYFFDELDFDYREELNEFLEKNNIEYDWYSSTVLYIYF